MVSDISMQAQKLSTDDKILYQETLKYPVESRLETEGLLLLSFKVFLDKQLPHCSSASSGTA